MSKLLKNIIYLALAMLAVLSLSAASFSSTSSPQKHRSRSAARARHSKRSAARRRRHVIYGRLPQTAEPVRTVIVDPTLFPSREAQEPAPRPPLPRGPISGGVLNGRAISLPKPPYPPIARAAHAEGQVIVKVVIDEDGNVISAQALSGHPLLRAAAVDAARHARFAPTQLSGQPVKVSGTIIYNFVAQ
ncbi:MAG TPA: TonB family protein [Pyrinomonadaceae bacterium]|nr:TonB family protein [Pyrinomonadaceae bacterium]